MQSTLFYEARQARHYMKHANTVIFESTLSALLYEARQARQFFEIGNFEQNEMKFGTERNRTSESDMILFLLSTSFRARSQWQAIYVSFSLCQGRHILKHTKHAML